MSQKVYIIGAGGHAKVVAEIVAQLGHKICGFLDDDETLFGQQLLGYPIIGSIQTLRELSFDGIVIGIGDNKNRSIIVGNLPFVEDKFWIPAVHSNTIISPNSKIGIGTIVVAGAIINIHANIGSYCIINTGATIDHDCAIGNFAHIAPGVNLAGNVTVGEGAFLGIGATVIPGCKIGDWAIVGAGATVVSDVASHCKVVGTPAKPLSR